MIARNAFYQFMDAQIETEESIEELEAVLGCGMFDGEVGIFTSYNQAPTLLENICFPQGADDDTLDKFYEDYWNVVNSCKSMEEFYDIYFERKEC